MKIILNGQEQIFNTAIVVGELLSRLGIDPATIAFERNMEIVPCSEFDITEICDGDRIEIVRFIGGG